MVDSKCSLTTKVDEKEWVEAKCDKYDYLIAVFCGGAAGLIDIFFVGDPLISTLGKSTDKLADEFVKKAAQYFWKNDARTVGKNKKMPQTLEQCISYLEQAFPVKYDARYAKDLIIDEGVLAGMRPLNHHLLSLSHSPDPIGLIFSIIDQFMGYATFVDKGEIIRAIPRKSSNAIPYMQGSNLISMLFCGFVNWIGHLLSDMVGSSSTRSAGKTGRGAGIPIPFYELFLGCEFGNRDGKTLAEVMIKVFEEGYDFRFGATMAIPIVLEELMIKSLWVIRQKFVRRKTWRESFPSVKHADLRIMLIIGNGTLCAIDGTDAVVHGAIGGGNVVAFICRLNLIGWIRLLILVLKELTIQIGPVLNQKIDELIDEFLDCPTKAEKEKIGLLKEQLKQYDAKLDILFAEFVRQINEEYSELYYEIDATFDRSIESNERNSVRLARLSKVEEKKIVHNINELDKLFM